jgi:hypothetical protein
MKKIILSSIFIAGILILATSIVSVIGTDSVTSTGTVQSPLFTHRTQQSNQQTPQQVHPNYLGKGQPQLLSFSSRSSLDELVDNAVQLINQNPKILDKISTYMQNLPATALVLKQYHISQSDLDKFIMQIKNDPSLLQQQLEQAKAEIKSGGNPAHPLSLNTTNPFACVITIIVLIPVMVALLVLVLIIATITIITCLNINNCLTKLTDQIQNIITQHLLPP